MPNELQQTDGIREIGTFTLRRHPLCLLCGHCIEVGVLLAATPYILIPYTFF